MFRSVLFAVAVAATLASGLNLARAEEDTRVPPIVQPATPPAVEPSKPDPVPDTSEQRSGKLWVCCDDGNQRWTATPEVCRQRKGQLLPARFCERPTFVCCRTPDGGSWMQDAAACARAGGEASDARYCSVCCKQGRAEWWMPDDQACYRDGGVVADRSYCR